MFPTEGILWAIRIGATVLVDLEILTPVRYAIRIKVWVRLSRCDGTYEQSWQVGRTSADRGLQ